MPKAVEKFIVRYYEKLVYRISTVPFITKPIILFVGKIYPRHKIKIGLWNVTSHALQFNSLKMYYCENWKSRVNVVLSRGNF